MPNRLRPRLTFANVVSCLALFVALGGSAYAVKRLPKNSVGTEQLKKNAVTKKKVRKSAIDSRRVKNNSLTGADIKLSKLGTVPAARNAAAAGTANRANVANTATAANVASIANVASSLAPAEGWHEVGDPGEPEFLNSWENVGEPNIANAAFYRDHEGIVHLRGYITGGSLNTVFRLPPGYRPPAGKFIYSPAICFGGVSCSTGIGAATIYGPGSTVSPEFDGAVNVPGEFAFLEGITFRAES